MSVVGRSTERGAVYTPKSHSGVRSKSDILKSELRLHAVLVHMRTGLEAASADPISIVSSAC